jgi:CheY-like chemotaxis protein
MPRVKDTARTVMVVEDEPDLREIVREVIEAEGYSVTEAANGKEAQQHLRSVGPPSLILLDLMMPVMNGWDFLAWLRSQPEPLASVHVVVVSAASPDRLESVKSYDAVALVRKPLSVDQLLRTVSRFTA